MENYNNSNSSKEDKKNIEETNQNALESNNAENKNDEELQKNTEVKIFLFIL